MTTPRDLPVNVRLINGARLMGKLWREGVRCQSGWAARCACPQQSQFCRAKAQWVLLACGRQFSDSPFAVVEAMTGEELKASGLTVEFEIPELGRIRVGPAGQVSLDDVARTERGDLRSVLSLIKSFPGSTVESE